MNSKIKAILTINKVMVVIDIITFFQQLWDHLNSWIRGFWVLCLFFGV